MKRFAIAIGLIISLKTASFAQESTPQVERKTPEEIAKTRTEMLDKKLNLSAGQKEKVYEINLEEVKNRQAFKQEAREEARKRFKDRRETFKETDEKLNEVLNEQQKQKYKELKEKRKEQLKERRGKHRSEKTKIR